MSRDSGFLLKTTDKVTLFFPFQVTPAHSKVFTTFFSVKLTLIFFIKPLLLLRFCFNYHWQCCYTTYRVLHIFSKVTQTSEDMLNKCRRICQYARLEPSHGKKSGSNY